MGPLTEGKNMVHYSADPQADDVVSDLDALNARVKSIIWNKPYMDAETKDLLPAQFVKDLGRFMDRWFSEIVDGD